MEEKSTHKPQEQASSGSGKKEHKEHKEKESKHEKPCCG
jgi:hypothetical protein